MGIGGVHPDFVFLDEAVRFTGFDTRCPPCQEARCEECWQHDPPPSVPMLGCGCTASLVPNGPRFVSVQASVPRTQRGFPKGDPGWMVFDRAIHRTVGRWMEQREAAESVVADLNGPTQADVAAAAVRLREALDLL